MSMGLFQSIFGKIAAKRLASGFWTTLDGYTPSFLTWGGELYESEIVRASIHATATHASKLSVTVQGTANPRLQTRDIVQYGTTPWLRYPFRTGQTAVMEMERCGIMTKFQYKSDIFGENNGALKPTMDLVNLQNQGIAEAVKNGATFRFAAKMGNFSSDEDLKKERQRFSRENLQGEGGGILLFPNTYTDIKQLESKPYVVAADEMERINTNVFNYFGTNEDVLQNRAYGDKWSAFYEGKIEPFSIQFSDVATKMLFTERERAGGTLLMATANRLQYMSNTEKLNVSAQMADRGIMNRDEIREIWNLPPLPDGQGQAYTIRGEYYLLGSDGSVTKKGDDLTSGK